MRFWGKQSPQPTTALFWGACALFILSEWALYPAYYKYFMAGGAALGLLGAALTNYKYLWYLGIAAMPVSMTVERFFPGAGVTLPSDFIAIGLLLITLLRAPAQREALAAALNAPITRVLGLYLLWMAFTAVASSQPAVSLKFLLSAAWYAGGFYIASIVFFQAEKERFRWLYLLAPAAVAVAIYTIVLHGLQGFSYSASIAVMQPFYKEHTAYAASIVIPAAAYFILALRKKNSTKAERIFWLISGLILAIGVATSYTRGAWLGFLAAAWGYLLLIGWRQYRGVFWATGGVLAGAALVFSQVPLNFGDPNDRSKTLGDHLFSVFNTQTDLSNIERFNRWTAAFNMLLERPFLGFGPGTYAMEYAPFQQSAYKTFISTNQGVSGTAHNEFLLAGSEMGWIGVLLVVALYVVSLWRGWRGFHSAESAEDKTLYAVAFCGLITYYVHAFVNNFLDQDKIAIPVYLCLALLTALDAKRRAQRSL